MLHFSILAFFALAGAGAAHADQCFNSDLSAQIPALHDVAVKAAIQAPASIELAPQLAGHTDEAKPRPCFIQVAEEDGGQAFGPKLYRYTIDLEVEGQDPLMPLHNHSDLVCASSTAITVTQLWDNDLPDADWPYMTRNLEIALGTAGGIFSVHDDTGRGLTCEISP